MISVQAEFLLSWRRIPGKSEPKDSSRQLTRTFCCKYFEQHFGFPPFCIRRRQWQNRKVWQAKCMTFRSFPRLGGVSRFHPSTIVDRMSPRYCLFLKAVLRRKTRALSRNWSLQKLNRLQRVRFPEAKWNTPESRSANWSTRKRRQMFSRPKIKPTSCNQV